MAHSLFARSRLLRDDGSVIAALDNHELQAFRRGEAGKAFPQTASLGQRSREREACRPPRTLSIARDTESGEKVERRRNAWAGIASALSGREIIADMDLDLGHGPPEFGDVALGYRRQGLHERKAAEMRGNFRRELRQRGECGELG